MPGPLSSVMMIATAGLVPSGASDPQIGASLDVSANLVTVLTDYNSLPVIQQFTDILTAAGGNVITANTLATLQTVAANTIPALSNAVPEDYWGDLTLVAPGNIFQQYDMANVFVGGFSGLINDMAENIMGGGDLTRFAQIYSSAQGYAGQANQFINSNLNVGTISSTFGPQNGGMDSVITGGFNQVTEAFGAFGQDLQRLGSLINMKSLDSLGSPVALIKQVIDLGGLTPTVTNLLRQAGLTSGQISSLAAGSLGGITDSANKLLYEGMTRVTGDSLQQICTILGVTLPVGQATLLPYTDNEDAAFSAAFQRLKNARTGGVRTTTNNSPNTINTMADLLNPVKIFPNSFYTLTMPTPDGLRAIYATQSGAVNTNLEQYLSTTTATVKPIDPGLINRVQQDSEVVGATSAEYQRLKNALPGALP